MAGEEERKIGANASARTHFRQMQTKMKNGAAAREVASRVQDETIQTTETVLPRVLDTSYDLDVKIVATSTSDANALNQAIADPEKPHIEAYPSSSDESTESK